MNAAPSPLAKRILAVLRHVGKGNGYEAPDISLNSEENGRFTLYGSLALKLVALRQQRQEPGRPGKAHVFSGKKELDAEVDRALQALVNAPNVLAVARESIIEAPGSGFAGTAQQVRIPNLTYDFAVVTPCPTCRGKGQGGCPVCHGSGRVACPQCRGQREEWCGHCRGSGHANGDATAGMCTYCHGKGRTSCLRCAGSGHTTCQPCNGTGAAHCQTCLATGELADVTTLNFAWNAAFLPARQIDIPRAVGHLTAATSMDMLVHKGHIAPKVVSGPHAHPCVPDLDPEVPVPHGDKDTLYWHVSADIPWCEASIKAKDKSMIVTAAGLKGRLNNCPSFLDKQLDNAARLNDDALTHLLRFGMRQAERALAKDYPVGVSAKGRAHILRQAKDRIARKTARTRAAAWLLSLSWSSVVSFLIKGDIGALVGFIISVVIFHGLMLAGKLRFAREANIQFKFAPNFSWEVPILAFLAFFGAYILPMALQQLAWFN